MNKKTKKILIVEDNKMVASMVEFILTDEGFEVAIASDADEAFEKFSDFKPDLIISDIMLPKTDGLVFVRAIKKISAVPVILLTALVGADHQSNGMAAGAVDYITKPFDPQDLVLRVKAALESS